MRTVLSFYPPVQSRLVLSIPLVAMAVIMAGCGGTNSTPSLPSAQAPSANIQMESEAKAMRQASSLVTTTDTTTSTAPAPIRISYGGIIGLDNTFSPVDGDTSSGGNGTTIGGVPCDNSAIPYHIHAHVSLLVSGRRLAVPDAIGLHNPTAESNGMTFATICYYHLHTHDATGLIHMEAAAPAIFILGQLFAVWGQPLSSTNVAGHGGTVKVFLATAKSPGWAQQTGPYTPYTGNLQQLRLTSHEEVVLEVGPTFVYPPNIPAVIFPSYQ